MFEQPFQILSDEEYAALSLAQKIDYLRRAMEARDLLDKQLSDPLAKSVDKYKDLFKVIK